MARPNSYVNIWKTAYLIGVSLFVIGIATMVGIGVYMVAYSMVRNGAPIEVLIIVGGLFISLCGAGIAAYTDSKANGG